MTALMIISVISITFLIVGLAYRMVVRPRPKLVKHAGPGKHGIYIFEFDDGSKYHGDCTVWYKHVGAGVKRCSLDKEVWLSNIWESLEFKRKMKS